MAIFRWRLENASQAFNCGGNCAFPTTPNVDKWLCAASPVTVTAIDTYESFILFLLKMASPDRNTTQFNPTYVAFRNPDLDGESKVVEIIAILTIASVLSTAALALRVYVRQFVLGVFGWDDGVMVVAQVSLMAAPG